MPSVRHPPSVRYGSSFLGEEPQAQLKVRFERRRLVFDVCLTSKGFTRAGASKVCPWHWGSPLVWMTSALSRKSTESFQNWGGLSKLSTLRSRDCLQNPVSRPSSGWLPAALAAKHSLRAAGISWSPGGSGERNSILEGGKNPSHSWC